MRRVRVLALVSSVVLGVLSPSSQVRTAAQAPADRLADGISPEALAQIDALIAEKDTRTPAQQKIDSQLLYEQKMESGEAIARDIWAVRTRCPISSRRPEQAVEAPKATSRTSRSPPAARFTLMEPA